MKCILEFLIFDYYINIFNTSGNLHILSNLIVPRILRDMKGSKRMQMFLSGVFATNSASVEKKRISDSVKSAGVSCEFI